MLRFVQLEIPGSVPAGIDDNVSICCVVTKSDDLTVLAHHCLVAVRHRCRVEHGSVLDDQSHCSTVVVCCWRLSVSASGSRGGSGGERPGIQTLNPVSQLEQHLLAEVPSDDLQPDWETIDEARRH